MQYKRLLYQGMASLLVVTTMPISSYAKPADNNVAPSAIYGARINMSIDQKTVKFAPQYFDPNKLYSSSRGISVSNIPGLSEEQMEVVRKIVSGLQDMNLSMAMIAGILGNLWQECSFKPATTTGSHYGLVQWDTKRTRGLQTMPDYETVETQVKYLKAELEGTIPATMNYGKPVDEYLQKYDNTNMRTVEDVEMACEAFCVVVEGCKKGKDAKRDVRDKANNGTEYQELKERKEFAKKCFDYLQKGGVVSEKVRTLLEIAESKLGAPYVWAAKGPDKFDCSGYVCWVVNQAGISNISTNTEGWKNPGSEFVKITNYDDLQAGDIFLIRYYNDQGKDTSGHIGIVGEEGTIYHAHGGQDPAKWDKVIHVPLDNWWRQHFYCGWRIAE